MNIQIISHFCLILCLTWGILDQASGLSKSILKTTKFMHGQAEIPEKQSDNTNGNQDNNANNKGGNSMKRDTKPNIGNDSGDDSLNILLNSYFDN